MSNDVREEQDENADEPIVVILPDILIDARDVQLENALLPIVVTLLHIFTVVNFAHE